MTKKQFVLPYVVLSGWGGEGGDGGNGSGSSSPDVTACTYEEWLEMYADDYNDDGDINETDFMKWWYDNDLGMDAWKSLNPDIEWTYNP